MKKLTLLLAIIGIVFSSCNGKYTIAKRKYNKGFYVSRNTGTTTKPEAVDKNTVSKTKTQEVIETEVVAKKESNALSIVPTATSEQSVKSMESKALITKSENPKVTSTLLASKAPISAPEKSFKKIDINKNAATAKKGSDHEILLIILCIFIPPLAVFIFEDSITTNFWVDLILTILGWLPGMIFAFLVCFAGVSL